MLKRSPLKRSPWGPEKRRRKRMKRRRNRARLVKLADGTKANKRDLQFGKQAELCRRLPCCVCHRIRAAFGYASMWRYRDIVEEHRDLGDKVRVSDPHHTVTRGAGGRDEDCVPLCGHHHTILGVMGVETFEERHGIDLRATARMIAGVLANE